MDSPLRTRPVDSPAQAPPAPLEPQLERTPSITTISPLEKEGPPTAIPAWIIIMLGLLGVISVVLFASLGKGNAQTIPSPPVWNHTHKAAVAHINVFDQARDDPWTGEKRVLRVSLFMPVPRDSCTNECTHSYMPQQTAKICNEQFIGGYGSGIFDIMSMKYCYGADQKVQIDASTIPVVVLEPHTDTTRFLYSSLAQHLTSAGVAVLLMDHPGDTSIVEFPELGKLTYNSGSTPLSNFSPLTEWNATVTNALSLREADIDSALKMISSPDIFTKYFPYIPFTNTLDTSSHSIIGHGLGGTLATMLSISQPSRVRFSINLSGSAPPVTSQTTSTIYFLGRSNFRREHDIHWPSAWPLLTGRAIEFDLDDSEIMDFTDLTLIVELARHMTGWKDLHAQGTGTTGAWGNLAVKCFVEGIVKKELLGYLDGLEGCVRNFTNFVPYMRMLGGVEEVGVDVEKRGEKYLGYGAGRHDLLEEQCDDKERRSWMTVCEAEV